jgi:TRAP-type C4-dicarboxylate transport system permease small subunit
MKKINAISLIFRRADNGIYAAEVIFGVALTLVMVIAVFLQVIFRYIINNPLAWSEELSRYVFVWVSMIGASIGMKKKAHYGLDALYRIFPEKQRRALEVSVYSLISIFLLVLVYYGILWSKEIYMQKAPGLEISMAIPYAAIPVGGLLMLMHILLMPFAKSGGEDV